MSTIRLNGSDLHVYIKSLNRGCVERVTPMLDGSNMSNMVNEEAAVDPIRQEARRMMTVVRQHEKQRRRQYDPPPHHEWGCTEDCLHTDTAHYIEALALSVQVGGIVITPGCRYAPGWMRPA